MVIPFRDKYGLTDLQALQIARNELTIAEINLLILQNCYLNDKERRYLIEKESRQ